MRLNMRAAMVVSCLLLGALLVLPFAQPELAQASAYEKSEVTWQVKNDKVVAKVAGRRLTGLNTIGAKTYYFDQKGVQRTGWRKVKGGYYYFQIAHKGKGYMVASKVVCGVRLSKGGSAVLTSAAKEELNVLIKANNLMDILARPCWGKAKKLRAAWKYMTNRRKVAERSYRSFKNTKNWHHAFALDIFDRHGGSCYSMGAAFAYLAQAAGYRSCKVVSSGGHGWALVDGLVYDPEWTTWHAGNWYAIKGSKGGVNYTVNSVYVATVCPNAKTGGGSGTSATSAASAKRGLVKSGGSYYYYEQGRKVTSSWRTVRGRRYYFGKGGKAVVGLAKVKGTYYVFNSKARLSKGSKVHFCSVGGKRYRVAASGRAKPGWNAAKTKRYSEKGLLMCGVWAVGGKFYAATSSGRYDAGRTRALRQAAAVDAPVAPLLELLGTPREVVYVDACRLGPSGLGGQDGIMTYAHFTLYTFRDTAGAETFVGIE